MRIVCIAENFQFLGEHQPFQVQHFNRAMDFLLEHGDAVQKKVSWATANLLNLAV